MPSSTRLQATRDLETPPPLPPSNGAGAQMPPRVDHNALQRLAILETQQDGLKAMLDKMDTRQEQTDRKIDQIHDVLMQAKGAKWAIISTAGFAGFLSGSAAKLTAFIPFLHTR